MSFKQRAMRLAIGFMRTGISVLGGRRSALVSARLVEGLAPVVSQETEHGRILFYCPGVIPEWRARTLLTKEPETIQWIDSFRDNDVMWDIGANVGVYTLYAASRNVEVVAFEPAPGNYYVLNRNIEINGMDDRVSALCVAFNDSTKMAPLFMSSTALGDAENSFAEAVNWKGEPLKHSFCQAMIGFSIDDFLRQFNPPFPNHIKIDVDGIEDRIIEGAGNTLSNERVRSVLVELDSSRKGYCEGVIQRIEKAGLVFWKKEHAPMFDDSEYSSSDNYFFVRPKP